MRPADGRGSTGAAESTADTVRQEGSAVAHTAAGEAENVAHATRDEGRHLADEAKAEVKHVADDARSQLREQVSEQAQKATDSLRRLGDQVSALAQGRPEDSGPLGRYVQSAADEIQHAAGRMEKRGFEGLMEDTKRFARRRPGAFLGIAAVAGFSIGRLLRGGAEARKHRGENDAATGRETADWPQAPGGSMTGQEGLGR